MTTEQTWKRYAAIWSTPEGLRDAELTACLADDVTYCDPNGLIEGHAALSAYMGGFQQSVPGASFKIRSVLHHHDRSLANWSMIGPGGETMQNGTSFGLLSPDGRLRAISGFFYDGAQDHAV